MGHYQKSAERYLSFRTLLSLLVFVAVPTLSFHYDADSEFL